MEMRPEAVRRPLSGRLLTDRTELGGDVRAARPAVSLRVTTPVDDDPWHAVPDLLASSPDDRHFVAEVDDEGRAILRFGDGEYGPASRTSSRSVRSTGSGTEGSGTSGPRRSPTPRRCSPPAGSSGSATRSPLGAASTPRRSSEVRELAPQAFHAELFRAVTEADWAEAARRVPDVQGAVATYRWTGSWFTVFVSVDPRDRASLVDLPNGRTRLEAGFEARVRGFLTRFRLAGYDIELRPPRFVPLDVELEVCAAPGHFRTDVADAVRRALSARVLSDGTRGFFHPDSSPSGSPCT